MERVNGSLLQMIGKISKEEKMAEIQKQLREKEAIKARDLLAKAMTHFEALQLVKSQIEKKLDNDNNDK